MILQTTINENKIVVSLLMLSKIYVLSVVNFMGTSIYEFKVESNNLLSVLRRKLYS